MSAFGKSAYTGLEAFGDFRAVVGALIGVLVACVMFYFGTMMALYPGDYASWSQHPTLAGIGLVFAGVIVGGGSLWYSKLVWDNPTLAAADGAAGLIRKAF